MSRFQTIEDVRTFCRSVAQLAIDLGDEEIGLMLRKALAAGDTSSPTERLGETILGLEAARKFMDDRYPVAVSYTHLDVYKRQQLGDVNAVADGFRAWLGANPDMVDDHL